MTKTSGTKEWAYKNLNTHRGCSNGCSYCYAKRMAKRFDRIECDDDWKNMKPNKKNIEKNYKKLNNPTDLHDYMFPTSHDITPESVDDYIIVLKKLLKAGNTILITTKANFECIDKVYDKVLRKKDYTPNKYKDQVEFRITIGSIHNDVLKKYEPEAPSFFYSRFASLTCLSGLGFKVSVSMEPFLEKDPLESIKFLFKHGYFNGDLWLGILSGKIPSELKENYTKKNVQKIVNDIGKLPDNIKSRIKFKDSIIYLLNLEKNMW